METTLFWPRSLNIIIIDNDQRIDYIQRCFNGQSCQFLTTITTSHIYTHMYKLNFPPIFQIIRDLLYTHSKCLRQRQMNDDDQREKAKERNQPYWSQTRFLNLLIILFTFYFILHLLLVGDVQCVFYYSRAPISDNDSFEFNS